MMITKIFKIAYLCICDHCEWFILRWKIITINIVYQMNKVRNENKST
jgi:hypothetical protein